MRKQQFLWVSARVVSLAAFSFFAGLGLRGLFGQLAPSSHAGSGHPQYASASAPRFADPDLKPAQLYLEVLQKLQAYYVEPLPSNSVLAFGSVESMLSSLNDPNTRLLSRAEVEAMRSAARGEYSGLGAVLTIRRHQPRDASAAMATEERPTPPAGQAKGDAAPSGIKTLTVVSIVPGGPAERAGLQPGDRIIEIDGRWVAPTHVSYRLLTQLADPLGPQDGRPRSADEPVEPQPENPERDRARKEAEEAGKRWSSSTDLPNALKMLVSANGEEHELTVERGNAAKPIKVKVTLAATKAPLVTSRKLNATTALLQLRAFSDEANAEAAETLAELKKSGVRNLVVDLRQNPGGSISAARDLAGMLLGDVRFAVLKERDLNRKLIERPVVVKGATVRLKPAAVSVLVDGGTAGAAELFAAALRDNLKARLVGTPTFGDGSEQAVTVLENGTGISITRAQMLTSKGVEFDGKGLPVDVKPQGDPVESAVKALAAAGSGA